ncbi:MAG: sortase, partial [Anaerolineales bacterium]|nr:sortase [Anaerolineales bacterium]
LAGPFPSSITYQVVAQVRSSATGDLTNTVTISHPADTTPGDNTASDTDTPNYQADLSVTKDDGVTVVSPGTTITYTVEVHNDGPSDVIGAIVSDARPPQIASWTWICFSQDHGANGCDGYGPGNGNFSDTVNLPAGASITYLVTAQIDVTASGTLTNTVTVSVPVGVTDPTPENNSDEDIDSIVTIPTGDLTKIVLDTNQGFTTHPSVAIGEILTYEIVFTVPAGGTMPNLTLTDILDRGLAFVDCVSITPSSANITTTLPGGFDAACDEPANPQVLTEPIGSTNQADDGRRIVFNLGTVTNGGVSDAVVRIRYQAVVLDNIENQENLALNNSVFLIWDTGALAAQATEVIIVEPALELTKTADTNIAVPGMVITFTLTVRHSALSQIDAYDVLLEDIIPTGLEYVPGSLVYVSGIAPTSIDDSAAPTLLVRWDDFPLIPGQSVIQFKATLQPLPPGASVTNEARVEWTSLPGNVLVPQSDFNLLSTERYYDPLSPVDIYGVFARFDIRVPSLPATGFAPGVVTNLPVWNDGMAYSNLGDLWLEIPALGVRMPIVGVPFNAEGWDLTWLGDQAGYLEGTAFPTSSGNTGITGHVYLPNGKPGPFVNLHTLTWGQKVIIHFNGMQYIYKVNLVQVVKPNDLTPLRHAKEPTLTLITCQGYNQQTNTYANRVAVRAVLVETRPDTLSSPGQVSPSRSIDPSRGR